jgi:hypothetical protein
VAEVIARMVNVEADRMPAGNAWKLYYTADSMTVFGMDVCNVGTSDAHVKIYILDAVYTWVDGVQPPPFAAVVWNLRLEADGTDGSLWSMPVKNLGNGDRVIVWSDIGNVTYYGHGIKFTA